MSLELETLLQPISEDQPCGSDYSFSNDFHAIKKAKTQDDPLLDQGDWIAEPKQADWGFVHQKSSELLCEQTKDIRLYGWLLEAWTHIHGFAGIAKGIELTQRSLENYWIQLHPEIEDEDLDQRLGLLQGIINQIPILIKTVPIVSASAAYSLADYERMLHQQNQRRKSSHDDDEQDDSINEMEQFEHALFNTSKSIQYQSYQQFLEILKVWQNLKDTLDQLMGLDAPSFAGIDSQIEMIHLSLKKIYKADAFMNSTSTETSSTTVSETPTASAMQHVQKDMQIQQEQNAQQFKPQAQNHLENREQAMRVLQDIADYFQVNEPHSPVSYMLQKTIKWSQMPLHEWLTQVIKNENPLEAVQEMLGVQQQSNESNSDW
ncbi:type VI secretion protein [Acinetobacter sp. ANC 5054]|uniref:type VI secretion system protein TssA n=1 Tax=Acinetobacter sp. ANC 5054 TaxID=1977877 RepID=UPI000A3541C0|nr:type VI secretion system protein TssA [Acinetobacter sp. ANC 5054]OTG79724.1 type VI secretion protein [Acinetobacter sp. ANC 5054]